MPSRVVRCAFCRALGEERGRQTHSTCAPAPHNTGARRMSAGCRAPCPASARLSSTLLLAWRQGYAQAVFRAELHPPVRFADRRPPHLRHAVTDICCAFLIFQGCPALQVQSFADSLGILQHRT